MTTSRQPWTTEAMADGKTLIRDANGKAIGEFNDWRDAELCIKCVHDPAVAETLKSENKELKHDADELEKDLKAAEERVEELEKALSQIRDLLTT